MKRNKARMSSLSHKHDLDHAGAAVHVCDCATNQGRSAPQTWNTLRGQITSNYQNNYKSNQYHIQNCFMLWQSYVHEHKRVKVQGDIFETMHTWWDHDSVLMYGYKSSDHLAHWQTFHDYKLYTVYADSESNMLFFHNNYNHCRPYLYFLFIYVYVFTGRGLLITGTFWHTIISISINYLLR